MGMGVTEREAKEEGHAGGCERRAGTQEDANEGHSRTRDRSSSNNQ